MPSNPAQRADVRNCDMQAPLASRHQKKVIYKSLVIIMENASNIPKLLGVLLREDIITPDDMELVEHQPTKSDKLCTLVMMFDRKPYEDWEKFLAALEETKNEHVAAAARKIQAEQERAGGGGTGGAGTVAPGSADKAACALDQIQAALNEEDGKKKRGRGPRPWLRVHVLRPCSGGDSDDECESDAETDPIDEVEKITMLILHVQEELKKKLNYYPEEYEVRRIRKGGELGEADSEWWNNGPFRKAQYFRVNCAIWVTAVEFYGPASATTASYTIDLKLIKGRQAPWLSFSKANLVGSTHHVVEVDNGQLVHVPFRFPVGVQPHLWYKLGFRLAGSDPMAIAYPEDMLASNTVECATGAVHFRFTHHWRNSTCQMPVIKFFKGKERQVPGCFPSSRSQRVWFDDQQDVRLWQGSTRDPNEKDPDNPDPLLRLPVPTAANGLLNP